MKLKITELKRLLEEAKDSTLIDNLFNYYFEGKFVPAMATEKEIVFYVPGSEQFFISEYAWQKDGIVLDSIKKLSFEDALSEDEKNDGIFKGVAEGIFEIDEGRKTFGESLKKMKKIIETDETIISEDVFLDRMKDMAMCKAKTYLTKPDVQIDNWKGNNENEFKKSLINGSEQLWKDLEKKVKETIPGKVIANFYDMYDINKMKFDWEDGKGVYKQLKVELPKRDFWIAENKTLLDKAVPEWKIDSRVNYAVVDDTAALLKSKKYVEDEAQCPCKERVSDLLTSYKSKSIIEKMWKWPAFKADLKEVVENKSEVETFIKKYEGLVWLSEAKIVETIEKALVDMYNDVSKLSEAKEVGNILTFIISENGTRKEVIENILGTTITDVNALVADLDAMSEEIRDYKTPQDDVMKYVEGLMNTIQDVYSRNREAAMSEADGKAVHVIMEKLNDIWARQRLTEDDKKFLKTVAEQIENVEKADLKVSSEIVKAKDEQRAGMGKFEDDILKKNTIEVAVPEKK